METAKTYKVIEAFSAGNRSTGESRHYEVGELIMAKKYNVKTGMCGGASALMSDGFDIPPRYVKLVQSAPQTSNEIKNRRTVFIVIALLITSFIIFKPFE